MIEIIAAIGLASMLGWILRVCIERDSVRRLGFVRHRDLFLAGAGQLLASDRLSDAELHKFHAMTQDIDLRRSLVVLFRVLRAMERDRRSGSLLTSESAAISEEWATLLFHYYVAITYSQPFCGTSARALMVELLDPKQSAARAKEIDRRVHPNSYLSSTKALTA